MARLRLLFVVAVFAFATGGSCGFEFQEATIDSIRLGFKNGSLTSTALVRFYLDQIARLNPLLHAVIEVNPDVLRQAASADAERASCHRRAAAGLHGVPVLIKDLIATRDLMNTTAGSLALLGSVVSRNAGVVSRLRRAGAVVLGKANLPEWANFRSGRSTGGLHGWSARGRQSRVGMLLALLLLLTRTNVQDPYVLSANLCGSSTGSSIAAAANMAAATLGTETMDSILCPASQNSVVGIKPTVGLTSRFSSRQDTVGQLSEGASMAHGRSSVARIEGLLSGLKLSEAESSVMKDQYVARWQMRSRCWMQ